jgi:hypothetical protein
VHVKSPKRSRKAASRALTFEDVRRIALALPGVEEGTSYGTPAFRVGGKLLARLHDSREALVVKVGFDEREMLMAAAPDIFFITDHYRGYPMMLVRIARVEAATIRRLLENTWREIAPKKLVKSLDDGP